jgi:FtsH-binding integral membrane protein
MEITFIALAILSLIQITSKSDVESLRGSYTLLLLFGISIVYIDNLSLNSNGNLYLSLGLVCFIIPITLRLYNYYNRNREES